MAVLAVLVENAGSLVSSEDLLAKAWPDRVVGRDSLCTAIYGIRKLLHDDAASPNYIRTEARRGYRLIAPVSTIRQQSTLPNLIQQRFAVPVAIVIGGVLGATMLDSMRTADSGQQYFESANTYDLTGHKYSASECPDKKRVRDLELVTTSPTG